MNEIKLTTYLERHIELSTFIMNNLYADISFIKNYLVNESNILTTYINDLKSNEHIKYLNERFNIQINVKDNNDITVTKDHDVDKDLLNASNYNAFVANTIELGFINNLTFNKWFIGYAHNLISKMTMNYLQNIRNSFISNLNRSYTITFDGCGNITIFTSIVFKDKSLEDSDNVLRLLKHTYKINVLEIV